MSTATIKQKKELAKLLYLRENLTQKEIAQKSGVSEVTISKWIKTERWEGLKTSISITREEQLANLYRQIAAINEVIISREAGKRFPNSKEADAINKIAGAIEKMERDTGLADIISVATRFLEWVRNSDHKKAMELSGYFDAFIKNNLR